MNAQKEIQKLCKREGFTVTDFIERGGSSESYYIKCESKSKFKTTVVFDGYGVDDITIYVSSATINNYAEIADMENAINRANSVADGIAELFGFDMF